MTKLNNLRMNNQICVFGLGYVGQTLSIVLSESGFKVIGIEKNIEIVKKINNCQSNIYEPKINEKLKNQLNQNARIKNNSRRRLKSISYFNLEI